MSDNEAPGLLVELKSARFSTSGGRVDADGVAVTVPPEVSPGEVDVRVLSPIPVPDNEIAGVVVEVAHDEAIERPIMAEWDVSALSERQRTTLMLVRWDQPSQRWLVEDVPFDVDNGTLSVSISEWSFWSWIANASQEIQEVFGRRKDPPRCNDDLPGWVDNFVDPDAETSAAAVLVCVEDDADEPNVITMRIVNNRTIAQLVNIDSDEGFAWNWEGQLPLGIAAAVHSSSASVLNRSDRVIVPPLHEVAVGISRPAVAGEAQFVGLSTEVNGITILTDVLAFGAREVDMGGATDNPLVAVFLEVLLDCGLAETAAWRGEIDDIARSVIGTIKDCVLELAEDESVLGRDFRQRVSERIVAYGSPEAASDAIRANRILQSVVRVLKVLKFFEVVGYLADLGLEATVGSLQWGVSLDGQTREPGDWTPTCSEVETDRRAWSRNWVTQEVFNTGPKLDFHEYAEFEQILVQATAPLSGCSRDHIQSVSDAVFATGFGTPETAAIAERVFAGLLEPTEEFDDSIYANGPLPVPEDAIRFSKVNEIDLDEQVIFVSAWYEDFNTGEKILIWPDEEGLPLAADFEARRLIDPSVQNLEEFVTYTNALPAGTEAVFVDFDESGDVVSVLPYFEGSGEGVDWSYCWALDLHDSSGEIGPCDSDTSSGGNDCDQPIAILRELSLDLSIAEVETCSSDWAYVDSGELGDAQFLARRVEGRWESAIYFPSQLCRSEVIDMGAPPVIVDKARWVCEQPAEPEPSNPVECLSLDEAKRLAADAGFAAEAPEVTIDACENGSAIGGPPDFWMIWDYLDGKWTFALYTFSGAELCELAETRGINSC